MNYELEVSRSLPVAFNSLNGGLPPLVSGSGTASRLTTNTDTTFPAFNKGYESTPFSLEVWFLPLTNTGEAVVIGHATEGVLWDGTRFILRVKQGDGTIVSEVTWTPSELKAFHVVMTYVPGQATLYVDGLPVANLELLQLPFASVGAAARINGGTTTAIYDSLALYYRAITSVEVMQHYRWGNDVPDATTIAMTKGGTTWSMSYQDADILESVLFAGASFSEGYVDNVGLENNLLVAGTDDGGTWRQSIAFAGLTTPTTAGIHVTYEGQGATVSYSLDGATWTPVANKTTILEDAALPDSLLMIQVQLADGDSWLNSVRLDALASRLINPLSGRRRLTFKSVAFDQTPGNQLDYQNDAGATIRTGGFIEVSTDTTENPNNVKAVEFWAKFDQPGTFFLSDGIAAVVKAGGLLGYNTGALEIYMNGAYAGSDAANVGLGRWNFYRVVLTTADNKTIRVGDAGSSIYGLATYPALPINTYNLNIGVPALRVDDTSAVNVTESSPATRIYAYSWSYVSGGR